MSGAPAGFTQVQSNVEYDTANGRIPLDRGFPSPLTQYSLVPAVAAQAGDFYSFTTTYASSDGASQIIVTQHSTGGPITVNIPPPFSFTGPTPALLPTFQVSPYTGFAGSRTITEADVNWSPTTSGGFTIRTKVTDNFLSSTGSIIKTPDLSSMPGFLPRPDALQILWSLSVQTGTIANSIQPNGSSAEVSATGSFPTNFL